MPESAWSASEEQTGLQPLNLSSVVQNHPIGKIARGYDVAGIQGEGEFIYLPGCTGTVAGSLVTYTSYNGGATALAVAASNTAQPLAVSMSANIAGQWGWYQLGGCAVIATSGTLAAGTPVYLAGTGLITGTAATGRQVVNAQSQTAGGTPAAGLAYVQIDRPFAQGAIT